jgi:dihydroneopterin aldolase
MALISLEKMEFYAYHGCFKEEQQVGAWFEVDVNFKTSTSKAELTDNLHDTVDYQDIYLTVKQEMEKKSKLLEHVTRRIHDAIIAKYPVISVTVIVRKKNPSLGGKVGGVSVKMSTKVKNNDIQTRNLRHSR